MNFKSILISIIVFLNIFHYTYSENNNLRNTFNLEKNLNNELCGDITEMSLSEEIFLYNFNDIINCINIYYQNIQKKNSKYIIFEEYRDYWKPYSLKWICKKIQNNTDL